MKALIDLHTHTLVSGHAYSTIKENVEAAKLAGLKYIGLSEHAPNMPASPHAYYFQNVHVIPKEIDGVRVIQGIEANILVVWGDLQCILVHLNRHPFHYAGSSLHCSLAEAQNSKSPEKSEVTTECGEKKNGRAGRKEVQ